MRSSGLSGGCIRGGTLIILGLMLLAGPAVMAQNPATLGKPADNDLLVLKSDEQSIVLTMTTPEYQIHRDLIEGTAYDLLEVEGLLASPAPGQPHVPGRGLLLGIPAGAELELRLVEADYVALLGDYRLPPVPHAAVEGRFDPVAGSNARETRGPPPRIRLSYEEDPVTYNQDAFGPAPIAEVVETGFIRDQRFARLVIYPFQYNPAREALRYAPEITLELRFSYPRGWALASAPPPPPEAVFERVLQATIANYDSARRWRGGQLRQHRPAPLQPSGATDVKVLVDQDGIYQVTRADLQGLGIDTTSIDPDTFRLHNQGNEVSRRIVESAGIWDAIIFYGEKVDSKYTDTNVYWLTFGGSQGLDMGSRTAPPSTPPPDVSNYASATAHLEQNDYYLKSKPWSEGDHWWWGFTYYPFAAYLELSGGVVLDHIVTNGYNATLRTSVHSFYDKAPDPDHCVQLLVNGNLVDEHTWNGEQPKEFADPFPASYLVDGANTVTARGCHTADGNYDLIYYNWFEIDYWDLYIAENDVHAFSVDQVGEQYEVDGFSSQNIDVYVYDTADPRAVSYLTGIAREASGGSTYRTRFHDPLAGIGYRYWVLTEDQLKSPAGILIDTPSDLSATSNQADYIVIAPAEFATAAQVLADHRATKGLTTMVVHLQEIYDEFNWGILHPEAIRDFLDHAYHQWASPAPAYVVLAGGGHYDYLDYLELSVPNPVPPLLAFVDIHVGEVPVDNQLACVNGGDLLPDIHIGRLPARTEADLTAMISKIIAYENSPPPGDWTKEGLFVADKDDPGAGYFPDMSRDLIQAYYPAPPYVYTEVYMGEATNEGGCPIGYPALECRQSIVDFFNAGGLFVHFEGHAGPKVWGADAAELLNVDTVATLAASNKLPVSVSSSCEDGYFAEPDELGLGEALVVAAGKGTVGTLANAGFGLADNEHLISEGFMDGLLMNDLRHLGELTLAGKVQLESSGLEPHLLHTYTLLADPALRVNALDADLQVQKSVEPTTPLDPGDQLVYTIDFANAGPGIARSVEITDLIPSPLINPSVIYASPEVVSQKPGVTFAWDIADLMPGASGQIQIQAQVDPQASSQTFVNEAEGHRRTPDVDSTNDIAAVSCTVAGATGVKNANILVQKTVDPPGSAEPGDLVTYTIVAANLGPDPASRILVTDVVPPTLSDLTFVYSSSSVVSQTMVASPGEGTTLLWAIDSLPPPDGAEVRFSAVVADDVDSTVIVNEAKITASSLDPDLTNNRDSVTTVVGEAADLRIVKTVYPSGTASLGDDLTYTLTFTNAGPSTAHGVVLTDIIPSELDNPVVIYTSSEVEGQKADDSFVWDIADLPPGSSGEIRIGAQVPQDATAGTVVNEAEIVGAEQDPKESNNQASVTTAVGAPPPPKEYLYVPLIFRRGR